MIDKLYVHGYKCLLMMEPLVFKRLNVLVGANASGKSSVLQTLLLLRQSANEQGKFKVLRLSGDLYEGGTAIDVLNPEAEHAINIGIWADGQNFSYKFSFDRNDPTAKKRQLKAESEYLLPPKLGDRGGAFAYLNAERIGPRVSYPLPANDVDLSGLVGKQGQYTAGLLARSATGESTEQPRDSRKIVPGWNDALRIQISQAQINIDKVNSDLELQNSQGRLDLVCNSILGWIIPGAAFLAQETEDVDIAPLKFIRDASATRVQTRATHVGFGLAYVLPIIAAGLSLSEDGIILVENPEAHLHPFSQSRIGVFLALLAALGRQVVVETHSDHVVNGIRLAIRYGVVRHEDIVFNYFKNREDGGKTDFKQIFAEADGALDEWPSGFFDQIEHDLARL